MEDIFPPKRGAIYAAEGAHWDWNTPLEDWFKDPTKASLARPRAPVCSACQMPEGDYVVRTAWGFLASRLPEKNEEWIGSCLKSLIALRVLAPEGQLTARLTQKNTAPEVTHDALCRGRSQTSSGV